MRSRRWLWIAFTLLAACADEAATRDGVAPDAGQLLDASDAARATHDAGRDAPDSGDAMRNDGAMEGVYGLGVRWTGRVIVGDGGVRFAWSGSGFLARFRGRTLRARLRSESEHILLLPVLDGVPGTVISVGKTEATYSLADALQPGEHSVELYRESEGRQGATTLLALTTDGELLSPPPARPLRIEVVGDSISAGFGALGSIDDADCYPTESHWASYAAQLARMLDAELTTIAASGMGVTRNYGGDADFTMREMYPRALPNESALWREPSPPHAVLINLGTNDISNGKGDPGPAFEQRYLDLLRELRRRYPAALLVCLIGPTLSGDELATMHGRIEAAVHDFNDVDTLFYDGIKPQTPDKFACAYHPNPAEHALIARQLAPLLEEWLE